jgi:hypothetical protein
VIPVLVNIFPRGLRARGSDLREARALVHRETGDIWHPSVCTQPVFLSRESGAASPRAAIRMWWGAGCGSQGGGRRDFRGDALTSTDFPSGESNASMSSILPSGLVASAWMYAPSCERNTN